MSTIQLFVDWETFGIKEQDIEAKIIILLSVLSACALTAIIWGIFLSNKITVYSKDDVEIIVRYGDFMKIAFPKKKVEERIVVIAVNCCFDTKVDQNLIRARSIHGQFLKRFVNNDVHRQWLDDEIEASLQNYGITYKQLDESKKMYGKRKRYPLGSIARINGSNGVTFFLMALTEFDVNCNAHCNKHQYVECLLKLFEYYDAHGQGNELYLYPMGTSMARTGLSKNEALEAVVTLTKISKEHLHSKTTIIVDKRDKNEISISDI